MAGPLAVGPSADPWFGPRIFGDAANCPASAAVQLRAWALPNGVTAEPIPKISGGWLATASLLRALGFRGPTSDFVAGTHPITDLARFASNTLSASRAVMDFAVAGVESLLDAQAATTEAPFDYHNVFLKMPLGTGQIHGGGAFAFKGPDDAWQLWRMRTGAARAMEEQSYRWALLAARVLAGHLDLEEQPALRTVEVFECGAADGTSVHIGGWDLRALHTEYDALFRGPMHTMAFDLQTRPGAHCASCRFVGACPSAPRIDGLLANVKTQPAVVKITASSLRTYAQCARRYQLLHIDGLPGQDLDGEALLRGRQVDEWLKDNHLRGVPCQDADVQRLRNATGDEVAAAMAGHHISVCPVAEPDVTNLTVQVDVAALDTASRVLLVGRPDAAFVCDGAVVWRETKTHASVKALDAKELVETDITAALYLLLLASAATGVPGALEWEQLTRDGADLTVLLADDGELVDVARIAVSAAVADLLADEVFVPKVDVGCATCPARRWCPDAP